MTRLVFVRRRVQPIGVARGLLGLAPLFQHQRRDAFELGILLVGADVAREFDAVAVGVEEIDRLEDAVMRRAEHVDAVRDQMLFGGDELVIARSEEHTSELQSLMRTSYAVFCLKKKT